VARLALQIVRNKVEASVTENTSSVGKIWLYHVLRTHAAAKSSAVFMPRKTLTVIEIVHQQQARAYKVFVLATGGRTWQTVCVF
jgi:hypothetical protein